jgi:hypothetical protein
LSVEVSGIPAIVAGRDGLGADVVAVLGSTGGVVDADGTDGDGADGVAETAGVAEAAALAVGDGLAAAAVDGATLATVVLLGPTAEPRSATMSTRTSTGSPRSSSRRSGGGPFPSRAPHCAVRPS